MVLTLDIGNTNIALGGFSGNESVFVARISTDSSKTSDEYAVSILSTLALYGVDKDSVEGAVISSVVPPLNNVVRDALRAVCGVEPLLVGPGIKTGINLHCDDPASVGADLICACVAVRQLYGAPALIIDMGTATKMTVMNKNGAFEGVSIIPGVHMGANALSEGTAQLPQVSVEAPRAVIGKNTVDSMRSGIVFGNASLLDGMIDRINDSLGEKLPIYATGGAARLVIPHCLHKVTLDDDLVLKGLNIIYNKNK